MNLQGKTALVTAGSRGIGFSVACCLDEEGAEVTVASRSDPDGFSHVQIDLMQPGAPKRLLEALPDLPDIVVHSLGGTLDITDPFCSPEDWLDIYRLNLGIAVELNRIFIPGMQRRGWGRVVHISSVSGLENQGTVPYCSMKAALNAYVRSIGRVVAKDGVCVSAVLPGAIFTEGGYWDHPRAEAFVKNRMAIGRLGHPDEIGKVVAFLCSDHASFVVGSSILVDGGQGRAF